MPSQDERKDATTPPPPQADQEDQLSPSRSLRKSAAQGGGQRIGNNTPLANPEVSFPAAPADPDESAEPER